MGKPAQGRKGAAARGLKAESPYPAYEQLPAGVTVVKVFIWSSLPGFSLVECSHEPVHRTTLSRRGEVCMICGGDSGTTRGFELPVKRLACVAADALTQPPVLF